MAGWLRHGVIAVLLLAGGGGGAGAQYAYPYGYAPVPHYPVPAYYPPYGYGGDVHAPPPPYVPYETAPAPRYRAAPVRARRVVQSRVVKRVRPAARPVPRPVPEQASLPTPFEAAGRDGGSPFTLLPPASVGPVPALPAPRPEPVRPGTVFDQGL